MPAFILKIQVGVETHRRWIDTDDGVPLSIDLVEKECEAMRGAGYISGDYVAQYRDVSGDQCVLGAESWQDFMATAAQETSGRLKLTVRLVERRPRTAGGAAPAQPAAPAPAGPAPAAHLPAPQSANPAPAAHLSAPPPPYPFWGPQLVPTPGEPMMMAAPAPPQPPPEVLAEEAAFGAPRELLYQYCFRQAQLFCRMCGAYVTEGHLRSRLHLRRLPEWRYWLWHQQRREAQAAMQPAWYYQAPPPLGPNQ